MAATNGNVPVLSTGNGTHGTGNGVAPNGNSPMFTPEAGFDPKANKIVNIGALWLTYRGRDSFAQKGVAADEQAASVAFGRRSLECCSKRFPGSLSLVISVIGITPGPWAEAAL